MPDISAILTGHRERLLAGPALASFEEAANEARANGLTVETIIVLDRPDELTLSVFAEAEARGHRLVLNDGGDPGLTRNRGVAEATGDFVAFLDADDLWSANWLTEGFAFCRRNPDRTVAHSEVNVVFGDQRNLWFHSDSTAPDFDFGYQRIANMWDAMSFARREIYLEFPFAKNAVSEGYAHEDWHWNNVTLEAGISHRPVPGTIHMKRRRAGSQMAKCAEADVVVKPTGISSFAWSERTPIGPGVVAVSSARPAKSRRNVRAGRF